MCQSALSFGKLHACKTKVKCLTYLKSFCVWEIIALKPLSWLQIYIGEAVSEKIPFLFFLLICIVKKWLKKTTEVLQQTLFNTSWSTQSLFRELKNGVEGKSFYRIKNKEQEEKNRNYDCKGHIGSLVWGEETESCLGIWGLADYAASWSWGAFTGTWKIFKFQVAAVTPWTAAASSWA